MEPHPFDHNPRMNRFLRAQVSSEAGMAATVDIRIVDSHNSQQDRTGGVPFEP